MTAQTDAPRVAVLPDALANQIAAGEVVERPASVVKELVENAIDAGAGRITIEIADAGKGLVRIVDDGEGMGREDAQTAVLRHATSKIRTAEDLSAIATLGFRGEALPSIASVSRFVLISRREDDEVATKVVVDGGGAPRVEPAASSPGTIIEVRDLFWNVPARLKFLKSNATEAAHVSQLVTTFALGHPHIHFKLLTDGKLTLDFPAARRFFDRAVQALGKSAQRELHEVAFDGPVRVAGFVSAPQFARGTPNQLVTFVNGRRVKDRTVQHAIVSAYGGELGSGRFPQAVLYVHLDPHAIDVNVHPTKAEVRFQNPGLVHESVLRAVQATLARRPWIERAPLPLEQAFRVAEPGASPLAPIARATELRFGPPVVFPAPPPPPSSPSPSPLASPPPLATAPRAKVIGQLAAGLVVIESADGSLLVIDPHVADRERIVRELEQAAARGAIASQPLLMPAALELDRRRARAVAGRVPDLAHLGLWVEPFGGQTFQVMGLPVPIARAPPGRVLDAVAALLEREPRAEAPALLRAMGGAAALPRTAPLASFHAASLAEPHAAAVVGRLGAADSAVATQAARLLVILGPTASGKTRLVLALAQALDTEVVSADSVQVYRGLDIGSAKPSAAERAAVRHHGLDVLEPTEPSHAGRWLAAVEPALAECHFAARGRVPIVSGGTGLYARALLLGLSPVPDIGPALRAAVRAQVLAAPEAAHAELARLDPVTAARLAPGDLQRVGRALEVVRQTGRPLSAWHADDPPAPRYAARIVVLDPDPAALARRIAARARAMVAGGLVAEVRALLARGIPPDAPGLATLGYREVVAALAAGPADSFDADALAERLARAHRQYAKRQRTWFGGSGMAGLATTTLDPDRPDAAATLLAIARDDSDPGGHA